MAAESKVVVALDRMEIKEALTIARKLKGLVWGFKIRLPMLLNRSIWAIYDLKLFGNVFVDPKCLDIESSMVDDIASLAKASADLITVHASAGPRRLKACVQATEGTKVRLLAVTALTDSTENELLQTFSSNRQCVVSNLWKLAHEAGVHGAVCGLGDISLLDPRPGLVVCPGFRPPGEETNEQQATGGYEEAKQASLVVIGRPITLAPDPVKKVEEINQGLAS